MFNWLRKKDETTSLLKEFNELRKNFETRRELAQTILVTALLATERIRREWSDATKETPISPESSFIVHMETTWFFLHVVNRTAFAISGSSARDATHDTVCRPVVTALVEVYTSNAASKVKPSVNAKEMRERMLAQALIDFDKADLDYATCKTLVSTGSTGMSLLPTSALGNFGWRVAEYVGQKDNVLLRMLVTSSVLDAMLAVKIPALVKRACGELG